MMGAAVEASSISTAYTYATLEALYRQNGQPVYFAQRPEKHFGSKPPRLHRPLTHATPGVIAAYMRVTTEKAPM